MCSTGFLPWECTLLLFLAVTLLGTPCGAHGVATKSRKAIKTFAGPFIPYADKIYMCEGSDNNKVRWYFRASHFNPQKPRELQRLTGNWTFSIPWDDNGGKIRAVLDIRSNNQWKENAFIFDLKNRVCSLMRSHFPECAKTMFNLDPHSNEPCVVPAGVYPLQNEPIDWVTPNFPVLPYGHYRFRIIGGDLDSPYACLIVECYLIPK